MNAGFSVIEVLLASALFVLFSGQAVISVLSGLDNNRLGQENSLAVQYTSAGLEAVRSIRNQSFSSLVVNSATGVAKVGGVWTFSGANNTFGNFIRVITLEDVQRDSSGNIVASGGTVDAFSKKISVNTNWDFSSARSNSVPLTTYLSNWTRGNGNWTTPTYASTFDLTAANSGNAGANATSLAYRDGKVYLTRANSGGREFYIFDVSNPASPALLGQRDLTGTPNAVALRGNYAYVGSTADSEELQIIDISDPATIDAVGKLTTVNLTAANSSNGAANVNDLTVNGDYLLMARNAGSHFLVFDIGTNPATPGDPVGALALTSAPSAIASSGNYAYVATPDNTGELQVIDITSKTAPVSASVFNLNSGNEGANGVSIALDENDVLVGRAGSAAPELYIIDVSTPTAPSLTNTVEIGTTVNHIFYDEGLAYAFLATNAAASNIKMVNLDGVAAPAVVGTFNDNDDPAKLWYDFALNRLFTANSAGTAELEVLKPS